jgi:hypothetical protein
MLFCRDDVVDDAEKLQPLLMTVPVVAHGQRRCALELSYQHGIFDRIEALVAEQVIRQNVHSLL